MKLFKKRRPCRALWLLPAAALLAGAGWYGNKTIETSVYCFESARLPQALSGVRIIQISDLHGAQFGTEQSRLLAAAASQKPDLIALTGDLADEYHDGDGMESFISSLCGLAPVFYVTGNHEWGMTRAERTAFFEMLSRCGVVQLQNDYRVLTRGGARMVIAGVDDPNGPLERVTPAHLLRRIRENEGEDAYILMLSHRNDELLSWAGLGVDAVLCGHAHGGIIRLPFVGPVFGTHYEFFPDDAEGVYRTGNTVQLVSRGLGQSRRIPLRIGNRPELPLIILESVP